MYADYLNLLNTKKNIENLQTIKNYDLNIWSKTGLRIIFGFINKNKSNYMLFGTSKNQISRIKFVMNFYRKSETKILDIISDENLNFGSQIK